MLVALFVSGFLFQYLGFYFNKVVKHRYGVKEKCCYCLSAPIGSKVTPSDVNTEAIDAMESVGDVLMSCDE